MKGGAPRAVWMVLHADPLFMTARSAADRLNQAGRPCHLVWNPLSGEMAQLVPVARAARALGWADETGWGLGRPGGWQPMPRFPCGDPAVPPAPDGLPAVNTEGRVCVQIGVIGQAWAPFTDGPVARLNEIVSWLDSWHVPRGWPAGRPAAFPADGRATRGAPQAAQPSRRTWARGGHFGASQVPGCSRSGAGVINIDRLTGGQPAPAAASRAGSPARIAAMTAHPPLIPAQSAAS